MLSRQGIRRPPTSDFESQLLVLQPATFIQAVLRTSGQERAIQSRDSMATIGPLEMSSVKIAESHALEFRARAE